MPLFSAKQGIYPVTQNKVNIKDLTASNTCVFFHIIHIYPLYPTASIPIITCSQRPGFYYATQENILQNTNKPPFIPTSNNPDPYIPHIRYIPTPPLQQRDILHIIPITNSSTESPSQYPSKPHRINTQQQHLSKPQNSIRPCRHHNP